MRTFGAPGSDEKDFASDCSGFSNQTRGKIIYFKFDVNIKKEFSSLH